MPYELQWYDEDHTIIRIDTYGDVTWDGWYDIMNQICTELDTSSHRVDLILYDTVGLPKGNAIPHLKHTMGKLDSYDQLGKIVSVNAKKQSTFVKVMVDIVSSAMTKKSGKHGPFVDTLDEALDFIEKDRQAQLSET